MRVLACAVFGLFLGTAWQGPFGALTTLWGQEQTECGNWLDCQSLALEAAQQGDYETFHDLAWKTLQTGPEKDPDLMYLLARAQSLSGRPYDALVTIQRLADELAVVTDAGVHDDFQQVRLHRDWPLVEAAVARARAVGAVTLTVAPSEPLPLTPVPAPTRAVATAVPPAAPNARASAATAPDFPTVTTPSLTATAPPPVRVPTFPVEDIARFSTQPFAAGGLAYDAVSGRYLFGDRHGRKLMVVGDGSDHTVEMVRGDSAGFFEVTSLEIDKQRGDLWVTSSTPGGGSGALHRLQLISGRPLRTYDIDRAMEPVRLSDVAVASTGMVLVLDSLGQRVLFRAPDNTRLESLVTLDVSELSSLTVTADGTTVHVAHREGLMHIDVQSRTVTSVAGPPEVDLRHVERIRRHRDSIVGVQIATDGSRRIVELSLDASGRTVTGSTLLADTIPYGEGAGPMFITVSNDEVSFLSDESGEATAGQSAHVAPGALADYVVRRISLK